MRSFNSVKRRWEKHQVSARNKNTAKKSFCTAEDFSRFSITAISCSPVLQVCWCVELGSTQKMITVKVANPTNAVKKVHIVQGTKVTCLSPRRLTFIFLPGCCTRNCKSPGLQDRFHASRVNAGHSPPVMDDLSTSLNKT